MRKNHSLILIIPLIIAPLLFSCTNKFSNYKMTKVTESDQLFTGIAAADDGRIFVNFPRWIPTIKYSVAQIDEEGKLIPYPN